MTIRTEKNDEECSATTSPTACSEVGESVLLGAAHTRSRLSSSPDLVALVGDGRELVPILKASAKTARARARAVDS